jgi:hypothetical protein
MEYTTMWQPLLLVFVSMTIGGAIGSFYMFWRLHTDYKLLEIDLQMALEKLQDCVGLCRELKEELDKEIYNEEIQKKIKL